MRFYVALIFVYITVPFYWISIFGNLFQR